MQTLSLCRERISGTAAEMSVRGRIILAMDKKKETKKMLSSVVLTWLALAIVLIAFQFVSFLLPDERVRYHIKEAADLLVREGLYPSFYEYEEAEKMDNNTESVILNIAYDWDETQSPLEKICSNYYLFVTEHRPADTIKRLMDSEGSDGVGRQYVQYWFGTAGLVRLLMQFCGIHGIRKLLRVVVCGLATTTMALLLKRLGPKYALAFGSVLYMIRPWVVAVSLQFAPAISLAMIGMILLLLIKDRSKRERFCPILFAAMGTLTAFFDLLTVPLVSWGLPTVTMLLLDIRENEKKWLRKLFFLSLCWVFGYAGMHLLKWGLATAVLHKNAFMIAIQQLLFRTDIDGSFSYVEAVSMNCSAFFGGTAAVVLPAWIIWAAICFWHHRKCLTGSALAEAGAVRTALREAAPFLLVSISPFLWYRVLTNHSWIHFWMTYRLLAVSMFAWLVILLLLDEKLTSRHGEGEIPSPRPGD